MVPDYYAMLDVDPGADRATIEAALARKQPVWSSGTRNPKTKHTYQSYLDQIPALRQALLGDPSTRVAYDAEREAARRVERDAKLDELQRLIRLRAAKGGLTVADRRLLRDEALKIGLTADDLERLAAPFPPKPEAPAIDDVPDPPADVLDPVMRRQLRVALDHLRRRDLYDALGVERDAPVREIALRADAERQRWMRKTQVTAEKTAWLEVATLAQSHLSTNVARARYDRTLALEAEDVLGGTIGFAIQGLKALDPGTRATLLDEAAALGVMPERAEVLIARACRKEGIARDGVGGFSGNGNTSGVYAPRVLRCRSCAGVTPFASLPTGAGPAPCRHCGASLRWICPVCQKVHWVDEPRCPCGFRIERRDPFVRHFEAAQRAFRARQYGVALAHLRRSQELAPKHVGSRKGIEKVGQRLAEIDAARASWELARDGRLLVAARAAVEAWGRLVDPANPDWQAARSEVIRGLREAAVLISQARIHEHTDPKAARELYRKCLAVAADLPEARAGLERCPPDPPSELTASFEVDRVRLRWSPPPPDGLGPVTYLVRRKAETAFQHPGDGVPIGEASEPSYDDAGVVSGTSVAYAVLARRGQIESLGAVAVGPIFLMGEVGELRVETRSREVDLFWKPPRGVSEVRVVRKRGGPPSGPSDGDRVEALIDQAHDRDLEHDRVYHYGIFAVYRTLDGRATASRGVFLSAQPHTPVTAPDAPAVSLEPDGRVRLRWVEPHRGIMKLLRSVRPLPHAPGTRLSPAQIAALEGDWIEPSATDHALDTPPPSGACYYTPMVSWGGTVTVGRSAVFSRVIDPSDLRTTRVGNGRVNLRWRWGPFGDQSLVVYRAGAPPIGPDDPDATVETVDEAEYARQGHYTITLPPDRDQICHLAVFALATVDSQPVSSPGLEPTARTVVPGPNPELTVTYSLRRPHRLIGRRGSVTFRTEPPGEAIPPTVLVTHARTVPLSADDGQTVARFPAASDGATFELPPGTNLRRVKARIFADPAVGPEALWPLCFRHPESDATRV